MNSQHFWVQGFPLVASFHIFEFFFESVQFTIKEEQLCEHKNKQLHLGFLGKSPCPI